MTSASHKPQAQPGVDGSDSRNATEGEVEPDRCDHICDHYANSLHIVREIYRVPLQHSASVPETGMFTDIFFDNEYIYVCVCSYVYSFQESMIFQRANAKNCLQICVYIYIHIISLTVDHLFQDH